MNRPDSIGSEGIAKAISNLATQHGEGEVFITERISFLMKNILKRARKNYNGVYDKPYDSITKEEKYFPPLTEAFTDGIIKSIDFDIKDMDIYSLNGSNVGAIKIIKSVLKSKLHEARFGEVLNEMGRFLCIDGTGIIKFIDDYDEKKKKRVMRFKAVDNLNIIADESANSLEDCFGILERSLMNDSELRAKKGVWWDDQLEKVLTSKSGNNDFNFTRYGLSTGGGVVQSTAPMHPVYDYWGQLEKKDLTGEKQDEGVWIEAHAVVYGVQDKGCVVLFAEENTKGYRPYVDCTLKKVIGRRTGRGVPEMLFGTQKYMNMLIEIRKKNAQILQNGLFKAKRGMGLTADTIISKLTSGGIIQVDEMDDFEQMAIQDTRQASYADEDRLIAWGERNTGSYDVRRGESLAASTSATSIITQDRNSRDIFQLVQENVGLMLEKLIICQVLPWIKANVKAGEIVMITGSARDLMEMDSALSEHLVNKSFVDYVEMHQAYPPNPEQWLVDAKAKQMRVFQQQGSRRYVTTSKDFLSEEVGVIAPITNETLDKNLILTKLQESLVLAASNPNLNLDPQGILENIYSILGIPTEGIYSTHMSYKTPIDKMALAQTQMQEAQAQMGRGGVDQANALRGTVAPQINATQSTTTTSVPRPSLQTSGSYAS